MLPSEPDVGQRQKRHADLQAVRRALADKHAELDTSISAQELEITQYRNAHHPVSVAELAEARAERDAVWRAIKSAAKPVQELAPDFEAKLGVADSVSDQRHDKAREVSELQSKLDALERLRQQAADHATRRATNDAERAAMDTDWARLTAALGMAGLPLHEFEPWRAARDKALRAQDALTDAQQALHATQRTEQVAVASLSAALRGAGIAFDAAAGFDTLLLIASDAVDGAAGTRARLDQLNKQRDAATNALATQLQRAATAQADFDAWSLAWRAAAVRVGLPETIDVAAAEGALAVMAEIDAKLRGIPRSVRHASNRCDTT
jgi:hypothetical protein